MAVDERTTAETAVVSAVLDYFEGWFDGDAARMERALHPDLAKRALATDGRTLDETTLTRNLRPLIDSGWIAIGTRSPSP